MSTLSRVGELIRQHDPDRFFTSLFAPQPQRDALWALYAFNHELARATETVREPMMAMIRLQWWREVVEGADRHHEVATPLRQALTLGILRQADLLALIEGREAEHPETTGEWHAYIQSTAGLLAVAAGHALGAQTDQPMKDFGSAYGASGTLRNRALTGQSPISGLKEAAQNWLVSGRSKIHPRQLVPASLPAVFARRDLRRDTPVRHRGLGDKLAVIAASITARV